MNALKSTALALTALLLTSACAMTPAQEQKETATVQAAYKEWRDALSSGKPEQIVGLYDDDAVLVATLANEPITTDEGRLAYFTKLMKKKNLKVTPQSEIIRFEGSDIAINTGLYTFSFTQNGKKVKVPARFTFVYEKDDGKWEIEDHHSSMLPIKGQAKKAK
jgi:uncharacterized protein (TIGR02246 family)